MNFACSLTLPFSFNGAFILMDVLILKKRTHLNWA